MEFILDSTMVFIVGVTFVVLAASYWGSRRKGRRPERLHEPRHAAA